MLHAFGLLEYFPQKDSPQLMLLHDRLKTEDISIDMAAYNQRKERSAKRLKQMLSYIKEEAECRGRRIGTYFGDNAVRACGICDNCLRQKATNLTKEEFESLHHRIINIIKYESLTAAELLEKLTGVRKEKAWKVLEFLQAEHKLSVDKNGWVKMR